MEKLALLGGNPTKTRKFPEWPQYDQKEEKALMEVLQSRVWWRTPGTKTLEFEQKFAEYQQAKYGIACTNGTAALEIVMAALGIGLGDEVIVPDYTFVASASAVLFTGAMPVMVDIDPGNYCIDPLKVIAAITPRTKAVVAVHLAGHPADLDRLQEICRIHNLFLIEDSAHAHGSEWKGQKVGSIGTAGTFSFQSSKLMTAGEGGMITTNLENLAVQIRSVHDCGRMPGQWFYSHYIYGSNYRLSEWQGAILMQQLSRLDEQNAKRNKNAAHLDKALAGIEGICPQTLDPRVTNNGHYCYIFHFDSKFFNGLNTEKFIEAINAEGIPTQASYPPVHNLDVFQNGEFRKRLSPEHAKQPFNFLKSEFPISEDAANNTVWLVHRTLLGTEEDCAEIVSSIQKIQAFSKDLTSL
ncbi:MAG: DegT/DnrJ/EryC1/StrS family aminotransferase [Chloroflexi bacterium]|nr:DegT/DnrJ/EryC1/StrS family aminotransferase [Chloroflexota bacterium]